MTHQTHAELSGLPLYTTCSCADGRHADPLAAERGHESEEFAGIIARNTGRHVVTVDQLATVAA